MLIMFQRCWHNAWEAKTSRTEKNRHKLIEVCWCAWTHADKFINSSINYHWLVLTTHMNMKLLVSLGFCINSQLLYLKSDINLVLLSSSIIEMRCWLKKCVLLLYLCFLKVYLVSNIRSKFRKRLWVHAIFINDFMLIQTQNWANSLLYKM